MQFTKHAHACVTVVKDEARIVIDPGMFTDGAAQAVAGADAVLITHEHPDHFDEQMLAQALHDRPELRVYGPAAVVDRWAARRGQVTAVAAGDTAVIAGFDVAVFGELHGTIHLDLPDVSNVGYLIEGRLYHPGDAYHAPDAAVETLLLPTSGPWTNTSEAVDYVRAVAPKRLIQIHELMLTPAGQQSLCQLLSPGMLTDVPLTIMPVGETAEV
jgi:L-ascorbate metabolism protein UlaG (beta-lactamase superfamily)